MHKLTKSFSNLPGPYRVAKSFKSKIDQFKQHLPILTTICNPGIKDRHWEEVGSIHYLFFALLDQLTLIEIQCQIHFVRTKCPSSPVIHEADVNNLCACRSAAL